MIKRKPSKDLQFHKIRVKSKEELAITDAQNDDKSDTESYISDGDSDLDLDEIRRDHERRAEAF
jgi:hypothetical protein